MQRKVEQARSALLRPPGCLWWSGSSRPFVAHHLQQSPLLWPTGRRLGTCRPAGSSSETGSKGMWSKTEKSKRHFLMFFGLGVLCFGMGDSVQVPESTVSPTLTHACHFLTSFPVFFIERARTGIFFLLNHRPRKTVDY